MKTRSNYKMPMFFGWYSIGSEHKRSQDWALKLNDFSNKDLEYLYKK